MADTDELPRQRESSNAVGEEFPSALPLIAYRTSGGVGPVLAPAPAARAWMDQTDRRFARRCLPLTMANQAGWFLLGTHTFVARWDGGDSVDALRLTFASGDEPYPVSSHFGYGIITFHIPYLFRTPPGWNLQVRGPANWPKAGVAPLEGLVETDWAVASFTMNWKMTATHQAVRFTAGEPICMLTPQRRGDIERFVPEIRDLSEDPELEAAATAWRQSRTTFNRDLQEPGTDAHRIGWQRHYFQGSAPDGTTAPEHQTKLTLAPVTAGDAPAPDEPGDAMFGPVRSTGL